MQEQLPRRESSNAPLVQDPRFRGGPTYRDDDFFGENIMHFGLSFEQEMIVDPVRALTG